MIAEERYANGAIRTISYWEDEGVRRRHREDGPAYIEFDEFGNRIEEWWYTHGLLHREDGPARIVFDEFGNRIQEWWHNSGRIHKEDGPAGLKWNAAGSLTGELWIINEAQCHRIDGPAVTKWNDDGEKIYESWCRYGYIHREDGPARQTWKNGVLTEEWWHETGRWTDEEIKNFLRPEAYMAVLRMLPQPIYEEIAAVFRAV